MPTIKKGAEKHSVKPVLLKSPAKTAKTNNVTNISTAQKKTKAVEIKIISEKSINSAKPVAKPVAKAPVKAPVKPVAVKKPEVKKPVAKKTSSISRAKNLNNNNIHSFFLKNNTKNEIIGFLTCEKTTTSIQTLEDNTNKEIYTNAMMFIIKESLTKDVEFRKNAR